MHSQHIRSWLVAGAGRCSRSVFPQPHCILQARSVSLGADSEESHRLTTPKDWDEFTTRRKQLGLLINQFSQYGSDQIPNTSFKPRDSLHKPRAEATISALLAAGAHLGHASTRMNPNFMPYAYGTRAGITIIDLDQTLPLLRRAVNVVREVARRRGQILFIGSCPELQPVVQKAAQRLGKQGYAVTDRWVPGTLTNRQHFFGPDIKKIKAIPDLAIILNPTNNLSAIRECATEHVPTIGVIDSNVDPRLVMYPIPANDENPRTAELISGVLSIAGKEGIAIGTMQLEASLENHRKRQRRSRFNHDA